MPDAVSSPEDSARDGDVFGERGATSASLCRIGVVGSSRHQDLRIRHNLAGGVLAVAEWDVKKQHGGEPCEIPGAPKLTG